MSQHLHVSNTKKRKITALLQQANQFFAQSKLAHCEQTCKKIDRIVYGLPHVLNLRGSLAATQKKYKQAEAYFTQALQTAPDQLEFLDNLARIYAIQEEPKKALTIYKKALFISHNNNNIQAILKYCAAVIALKEEGQALEPLLSLHHQDANNIDVLSMIASVYFAQNNDEQAEKYVNALLLLQPENSVANRQKALLASQAGDTEDTTSYLQKAMRLDPNDYLTYTSLAMTGKKYSGRDDSDIVTMQTMHQNAPLNSEQKKHLCFALGKVYDDLSLADEAFPYFEEGNAISLHHGRDYNADAELEHLEQITSTYNCATVCNQDGGLEHENPIFILGMPRCGSTLTEQIIASHHSVTGKGECNIMEGFVLANCHSHAKPLTLERIINFTGEEWQQLGSDYMEEIQRDTTKKQRITDKTLSNIRLIGAIHCALPAAKIIHVRRHPLDTCLSIYKNDFVGKELGFGTSLKDLAHYYHMYQKLMAHWHNVLPKGVMLEVNYEDIVCKQEAETRRILEFCNLDWDDSCLDFHKNKNRVQTASVAQVRRPIYKDSMAAWKRYEQHLKPLIDILGTEGWDATH